MTLIWKLLRKHISVFELAVFFIANLIGLVVILAGVQIYSDAKPLMSGEGESLIGSDFIAISKRVDTIGLNSQNIFTPKEVEELLAQDNIHNAGTFTASSFEVQASLDIGTGRPFSTYMFFEAVPDEFIDVDLEAWHVDISKVGQSGRNRPVIPIIIPRNYLNLYNFGFSRSQGLPQLTDGLMTELAMDIKIKGYVKDDNGVVYRCQDEYVGYIVGFSDRLNTILVPLEFINWANDHYGNDPEANYEDNTGPSRIILEVDNPSDPKLIAFLDERGYISEDKPAESGKALVILQRSIAIVVAIGALFCLLSVIILTLSIYLLLQKNIDKLENLVLIGHTPLMVSMPYILMTVVLNISILLVGIAIVAYGRSQFLAPIFSDFLGAGLSTSLTPTIVAGLILTALIICFNVFIILHKVSQISRKR